MKTRTLRRLVAALVLTPLAHSAIAEGLGDHPAVIVARTWNARGIDPNTFIVLHPAATQFLAVSPSEKADKIAKDGAPAPQPRRAM